MTIFRFNSILLALVLAACSASDSNPIEDDVDYSSAESFEADQTEGFEEPISMPDPGLDIAMDQARIQSRQFEEHRANLEKTVRDNKIRELERRMDTLEREQQIDEAEEVFGR